MRRTLRHKTKNPLESEGQINSPKRQNRKGSEKKLKGIPVKQKSKRKSKTWGKRSSHGGSDRSRVQCEQKGGGTTKSQQTPTLGRKAFDREEVSLSVRNVKIFVGRKGGRDCSGEGKLQGKRGKKEGIIFRMKTKVLPNEQRKKRR